LQVLAGDHLPGVFEQRHQHLERFLAETDPRPALEDLTSRQIDVEAIEVESSAH
jgi:hypothetical protein